MGPPLVPLTRLAAPANRMGAAQMEARMGASGEGGQDYADQLSATGRADRTSEESLAEFGRRLGFKEGSNIAISYMGYALK